jgi:hypothetical protein
MPDSAILGPVLIGLVFLIVGLVLLLAVMRRRGPAAPPGPSGDEIRRELAGLLEEFREAARAHADRLEAEVRKLKEAVADAERVRAELEAAVRRPAPDPPPIPRAPPPNPLHSRVYELRDQGKSPADIGVETGLEIGEVELILGLRGMSPRP